MNICWRWILEILGHMFARRRNFCLWWRWKIKKIILIQQIVRKYFRNCSHLVRCRWVFFTKVSFKLKFQLFSKFILSHRSFQLHSFYIQTSRKFPQSTSTYHCPRSKLPCTMHNKIYTMLRHKTFIMSRTCHNFTSTDTFRDCHLAIFRFKMSKKAPTIKLLNYNVSVHFLTAISFEI